MKRLAIYIILLALLLALLSACSSGSSESDEDASYGSASGSSDTGGPGSDESEYEGGDLVQRYDPEEDGYIIEEEQTPEQGEEHASEASSLENSSVVDGYVPEGEALAGEPYSLIEGVTEIPRKDRRYLCGYSTHVFVGEVIEETTADALPAEPFEAEPDAPPLPATQFIVKLDPDTDLIKGTWEPGSQVTASDAVTTGYIVNQIGGTGDEGLMLMEGDPLLIPGQRYLFTTNYDDVNNWYWLVVQPEGDVRITSDSERDRAIRDFKKGCKYEVTPEDVAASVQNNEDLTVDEQYTSGEDPDYVLREDDPSGAREEQE